MKIDGACHCGAIRFEAEVDPGTVSICHCTDCQSLTGTAYRVTVPARQGDFRLLAGSPRQYVKIAESGARRLQTFCGDCGSPVYATSADDADAPIGIRVGVVRQRRELTPTRQIWCDSALPWVPPMSGLNNWPGEPER